MKAFVAVTDNDWFDLLRRRLGRDDKNVQVAVTVAGESDPLAVGSEAQIRVARGMERETSDGAAVGAGECF